MTIIEYPSFFYLFPAAETLPGGITYYPPRPLGDSVVNVFVDEFDQYLQAHYDMTYTEFQELRTGPERETWIAWLAKNQ